MDVDAPMADGSNRFPESRARSESNQIPNEPVKLEKLPNGSETYGEQLASFWDYDFVNNKSNEESIRRAQYAYYKWNEQLKEIRLQEGMMKANLSERWSGVYQLIGFYGLFQGMIYQGVTTMASVLTCGFYKIPVILSVLASAATILAMYMNLSWVLRVHEGLYYRVSPQRVRLQFNIMACQNIDVKEFSMTKVYKDSLERTRAIDQFMNRHYKHALRKAQIWKWAALAFLTAYSALFSYLDYIVLCRGDS